VAATPQKTPSDRTLPYGPTLTFWPVWPSGQHSAERGGLLFNLQCCALGDLARHPQNLWWREDEKGSRKHSPWTRPGLPPRDPCLPEGPTRSGHCPLFPFMPCEIIIYDFHVWLSRDGPNRGCFSGRYRLSDCIQTVMIKVLPRYLCTPTFS
jgi:hypothetical protein